jgi:Bromodomain
VSQTMRKRKASPTKKNATSKRIKNTPQHNLPELTQWPEIGIKDITRVTYAILKRIHDLDVLHAFSAPVLEYFPDLESEYLAVVEEPMDLRTIEEERIHTYGSIRDLQIDLILMFNNCCAFNAEGDQIWEHAVSLWGQVNEVFLSCCDKLGVLLPRRWSP